ncbi:MAG: hypothetical protein KGZ63_09910 [Clostridiales bacterium]|nr:hypothetical protein [Clostridiales bacterium]
MNIFGSISASDEPVRLAGGSVIIANSIVTHAMHGHGIMTFADGHTHEGYWDADEFLGDHHDCGHDHHHSGDLDDHEDCDHDH